MNNRFPPKNLEENIYALLAFFDVFDRPVRCEDVGKVVADQTSEISNFLNKDKNISHKDGFYFLKNREDIVDIFKERRGINEKFWEKTARYVPRLYNVPFVRSVNVCNTLSFNNCDEGSDIDLFIIVKDGRIFTARTFATLFFHLLGVRRHGKKIAGRFCLSFFVTEDMASHIDGVALKPVDPYFFYWKKFLFYFGGKKRGCCGILHRVLGGSFGDMIEKWLERWHMKRYEARKKELGPDSDVVVSKNMLKFHNVDKRKELNKRFFERYRKLVY